MPDALLSTLISKGSMAKSRITKSIKASTPSTTGAPRFVCIHGHFYQPPRENPWLETVEVQDSAAPYHDWNDRITAECYAPNGASRITNKQDEIIRIMNNYARISFNFGPTLLSCLQEKTPPPPDRPRRQVQRAALQRTRLRSRPGLQPHDHAPGQPSRRPHSNPLGHR